ncbi:MAG: D-cysteine desulfhydrase family protein [Chloroflexota bacterium]
MTVTAPKSHRSERDGTVAPVTPEALAAAVARLPRAQLADLPTPLQECPRLSQAVGGPRILIKRDDLTGLALGGNKTRGLEFTLGEALAEVADVIVTSAAAQSNKCRQAAAACARLGLECHLVLKASVHNEVQGNLLLDHLLGAHVHLVQDGDALGSYDMTRVNEEVARLEADLRAQGRRPYVIAMHTRTHPLSGGGYLNAALELEAQLAARGVRPSHLVVTSGSGSTHAALALAVKALGLPYRVVGISIRKSRDEARRGVADLASQTAELYGLPVRLAPDEVTVYDQYFGQGYALPTTAGMDAIRLVASTEGILLDPVYTGKTMAGLIDLARRGTFGPDDTVVFVHTGGIPALFAYHAELAPASGDGV